MLPPPGRSSPATRRSRVDLPEPLTPIRPVRPGPKETVRPDRTGAPSGQAKVRSEQMMAVIAGGSQHVGRTSVTCGDTTASAVSLTSGTHRYSPADGIRDNRSLPEAARGGQEDTGRAGGVQVAVGGGDEAGLAAGQLERVAAVSAQGGEAVGAQDDPGAGRGQEHLGSGRVRERGFGSRQDGDVEAELGGRGVEPGDAVAEGGGGQDRDGDS